MASGITAALSAEALCAPASAARKFEISIHKALWDRSASEFVALPLLLVISRVRLVAKIILATFLLGLPGAALVGVLEASVVSAGVEGVGAVIFVPSHVARCAEGIVAVCNLFSNTSDDHLGIRLFVD